MEGAITEIVAVVTEIIVTTGQGQQSGLSFTHPTKGAQIRIVGFGPGSNVNSGTAQVFQKRYPPV